MSIATISNETNLGRASYSRVVLLNDLSDICCAERKRLTTVNEVTALEKRASLGKLMLESGSAGSCTLFEAS
jgi:hypothetical protein